MKLGEEFTTPESVKEIANRVFYMDDGGVYEDGTPEEIFQAPKSERLRTFLSKVL